MAGPLKGLKVLDLSRVLAGPFAGQILADLGADVIKVERPGQGDDTRGWGPPFLRDASGIETADAAYFLAANRGKRSLTLDLKHPEGQRIARDLATGSDIVLENFKRGGLAPYGLDYDSLKESNPGLIYCSITGFGHTGPLADRAGYDFIIQAMAGLMAITGDPATGPQKVGVAISDLVTGLYAAIGVLAALAERQKSGRGQHIDLALMDCTLSVLANQATNWLAGGVEPGLSGNAHPNIVPYQVFETVDAPLVLACGNDAQFRRFAEMTGDRALMDTPAWRTNRGRVQDRERLCAQIARVMAARTQADWLAALDAVGVPAGPINPVSTALNQPQARARDMVVSTLHDAAGPLDQVASPLRFSRSTVCADRPPPVLGAHSEAVLREAGVSADAIAELREKGVL
ncbi:CaiB/BaiF CoA transferase family protein [Yunchengibacter salinarum]|uniref:CaiB/BaiF CoA transferase family protein n=1 Tax=Yunchengibacter salinarum TaxID=3133399 RepID=UPI0035B660BA